MLTIGGSGIFTKCISVNKKKEASKPNPKPRKPPAVKVHLSLKKAWGRDWVVSFLNFKISLTQETTSWRFVHVINFIQTGITFQAEQKYNFYS